MQKFNSNINVGYWLKICVNKKKRERKNGKRGNTFDKKNVQILSNRLLLPLSITYIQRRSNASAATLKAHV